MIPLRFLFALFGFLGREFDKAAKKSDKAAVRLNSRASVTMAEAKRRADHIQTAALVQAAIVRDQGARLAAARATKALSAASAATIARRFSKQLRAVTTE